MAADELRVWIPNRVVTSCPPSPICLMMGRSLSNPSETPPPPTHTHTYTPTLSLTSPSHPPHLPLPSPSPPPPIPLTSASHSLETSTVSAVQFKMVSMRSEKPIFAPPLSLRSSPVSPLKRFPCSSDDDGPLSSF